MTLGRSLKDGRERAGGFVVFKAGRGSVCERTGGGFGLLPARVADGGLVTGAGGGFPAFGGGVRVAGG
ncbi:MAG: hypothetical protein J6Z49_10530, partial [Kiritimatiellae bacterium]|nr:hypothetical protein [Kiritimatiellia bacterium]